MGVTDGRLAVCPTVGHGDAGNLYEDSLADAVLLGVKRPGRR